MKTRLFEPKDKESIAILFHETVRTINRQDYALNQVKAWAPDDIYSKDWQTVCTDNFTCVAEDNGAIVGFGVLFSNGYIDCLYCHKNYQRQGVGSAIYKTLETKALALGLSSLTTESSITAKPFFLKKGFVILQEQMVLRRGEILKNYLMQKSQKS